MELDDTKLNAIIMELDILHRAVHDSIVEFYGAFFIESCVYYCMEYMDAGSLDKLYGVGVPEPVLGRIVSLMVKGLKFLKDEMQIIHRGMCDASQRIQLIHSTIFIQTSNPRMFSLTRKAMSNSVISEYPVSSKNRLPRRILDAKATWHPSASGASLKTRSAHTPSHLMCGLSGWRRSRSPLGNTRIHRRRT